jgi:hypothetical protein
MENEVIETNEEITAAEPEVRIVKIAECPSLSGRSQLVYHIGVAANGDVFLRLFGNSARGFYCKEWCSWALLDMQLNEAPSFTSGDIQNLCYAGRSVNSGSFLIAAMRNEGLVRNVPGSLRNYERLDPTTWLLEIQQLIASGISLSEKQLPVPPMVVEKPAKKSGKKPVKAKPGDASQSMES